MYEENIPKAISITPSDKFEDHSRSALFSDFFFWNYEYVGQMYALGYVIVCSNVKPHDNFNVINYIEYIEYKRVIRISQALVNLITNWQSYITIIVVTCLFKQKMILLDRISYVREVNKACW